MVCDVMYVVVCYVLCVCLCGYVVFVCIVTHFCVYVCVYVCVRVLCVVHVIVFVHHVCSLLHLYNLFNQDILFYCFSWVNNLTSKPPCANHHPHPLPHPLFLLLFFLLPSFSICSKADDRKALIWDIGQSVKVSSFKEYPKVRSIS